MPHFLAPNPGPNPAAPSPMRPRNIILLALLACGLIFGSCLINPQPEPPGGSNDGSNGGSDRGAGGSSANPDACDCDADPCKPGCEGEENCAANRDGGDGEPDNACDGPCIDTPDGDANDETDSEGDDADTGDKDAGDADDKDASSDDDTTAHP